MSEQFPTLAGVALTLTTAPALAGSMISPLQAVVQEVDDKQVVAVYTADAGSCALTMMVDESPASRAAHGIPVTGAARVRLTLRAGDVATVDGGRGAQVALTCDAGGAAMRVDRLASGRQVAIR